MKVLNNFFKVFLLACFLFSSSLSAEEVLKPKEGFDFSQIKTIPILHKGRHKPLDTFARETVRRITGSETFQGFEAIELLFSWLTYTDQWEEVPLIKIHYRPLIKHLQLKTQDNMISPKDLSQSAEFNLFYETVRSMQESGQKLGELEREGAILVDRLGLFRQIASGESLTLFPSSDNQWESLANLAARYPSTSLSEAPPLNEAKVALGVQALL
ncbi:MAG: hypothetical protein KDK66_09345, partial [Deltaproteobacteria bacterium]|nr:hypothetical protein [Deltaproteobacteria bacterium]